MREQKLPHGSAEPRLPPAGGFQVDSAPPPYPESNTSFIQGGTVSPGPVLWHVPEALLAEVVYVRQRLFLCPHLCTGLGTEGTQSSKVGQEHPGRAFVSVLICLFSNGTLGCRKSFMFYFRDKGPGINYFWPSVLVLSVHSLAVGPWFKLVSFGGKQRIDIAAADPVLLGQCVTLILLHPYWLNQ